MHTDEAALKQVSGSTAGPATHPVAGSALAQTLGQTAEPKSGPLLNPAQSKTLYVLGYLFLRMGHYDRAKRVFAALFAQNPGDTWARRNLAAIALEQGEGATALRHLQFVFDAGPLSTRDAALHLLRAKALWLEGRQDEARQALVEFEHLVGVKA